jgi:putative membrane protein
MVAALAAALWIAPAAAQPTGSSTNDGRAGSMGSGTSAADRTGTGVDSTPSKSDPATAPSPAPDRSSSTMGSSGATGTAGSSATAGSTAGGAEATLSKLHAANQAEIESGKWMREHAQNGKVKDFAKKMVDEHTKMDKDVMDHAKKQGVSMTSGTSSAAHGASGAGHLEELKSMSGAQADRAYVKMMVDDHQKNLTEVREAHRSAKADPSSKELASLLDKTAKKIEGHLKDAQKLQRDLTQRQARTPGR